MLPHEVFLRELLDLDLTSGEEVVEFLSCFGMIADRYPPGLLPFEHRQAAPPEEPEAVSNHLVDATLFLKTARLLTLHWLAVLERDSIESAWAAEGLTFAVAGDEAAWMYFVECLNYGLRVFTVRVERPGWVPGVDQGAPRPDLYSALCLQLANHISDNAPVRRCANEACRRAFVRQRGGAEYGQYRTAGVIYCSPTCGNSQWQRDHRRRKREERAQP